MMNFKKIFILAICFLLINCTYVNAATINSPYNKTYVILIDLNENRLFLIKNNSKKIIKSYPVASGKKSTPSPIGTWKIIDKGAWSNGFGTRWMGLNVPWGKYGIHGTNKPQSIGSPASMGCIRMNNNDVEDLYDKVSLGTVVIVYGGPFGLQYNNLRVLLPGNTGSDVFQVQKTLKSRGYYSNSLDGIYGDNLKKAIIKFEMDNKLNITHNINYELYKSLGMAPFE
ncbi:L,D-transpeptidase family protein [Clostridium acidisoli]